MDGHMKFSYRDRWSSVLIPQWGLWVRLVLGWWQQDHEQDCILITGATRGSQNPSHILTLWTHSGFPGWTLNQLGTRVRNKMCLAYPSLLTFITRLQGLLPVSSRAVNEVAIRLHFLTAFHSIYCSISADSPNGLYRLNSPAILSCPWVGLSDDGRSWPAPCTNWMIYCK